MKEDVLSWANYEPVQKVISKETLNHPQLIQMISRTDVYQKTPFAYRRAYQSLGIDIINRVPLDNAPKPTSKNEIRLHPRKPYQQAYLGVYDTFSRNKYECDSVEDVWNLDINSVQYNDLIVPVPHSCHSDDILRRQAAIGDIGLYYPMYYTTLFMWPVEVLGWEIFMLAATLEPERFHRHFLLPCVEKSKEIVTDMAQASDAPFIFLHDDLASQEGPMFAPSWYDDYIFPHYPEIWGEAKMLGKKIIFVADGNMSVFLPKLIDAGIDGIMFENPATPIDLVIELFGEEGRFFIGGIDTLKLTFSTPKDVEQMVYDLVDHIGELPGFAISSCGGLHGNIPIENLEAYFDARVEIGVTPKDWRHMW